MHVPDGEEDGDALAGAAGVFFVGCHDDAAVCGRNDGAGVSGNDAVRIAEEIKMNAARRRRSVPAIVQRKRSAKPLRARGGRPK